MATVTFIPERRQNVSAMKGVLAYCSQAQKTKVGDRRYVSGVNCDGESAFEEFMLTKTVYGKKDGMNFYQYVQSFSPEETVSYEEAHAIAREFAARAWPGYEVLVATHCDAPHIHSHFVVNSVSFETGAKLRQHPGTLKELRSLSDELCLAHGLQVLTTYREGGAKLSPREYRAVAKGESWKFQLMAVIEEAMKTADSREEFLTALRRRRYDALWTESRKYITYTCPDGKRCRDIRLHGEKFLKENMEYEFKIRKQIVRPAAEELRPGVADAEEFGSAAEPGDASLRRTGLRDPRGAARAGAGAAQSGLGIPARAVSDAPGTGDSAGAGGARSGDHEAQYEHDGGYDGRNENGGRRNGREIRQPRLSGWESARAVYLRMHFRPEAKQSTDRADHRRSAAEGPAIHAGQRRHRGDALRHGLLGLLQAGRMMEDDEEEDREELRRKIEARESAENLGAILGLAAGLAVGSNRQAAAEQDAPDQEYEGPSMGGL